MLSAFKFLCNNNDNELLDIYIDKYVKLESEFYKCLTCTIETGNSALFNKLVSKYREKYKVDPILYDDFNTVVIEQKIEIFKILLKENLIHVDYILICRYDALDILNILIEGGDFEKDNDSLSIYDLFVVAIEEGSTRVALHLLNYFDPNELRETLLVECFKWNFPQMDKLVQLFLENGREEQLHNLFAYGVKYGSEQQFKRIIPFLSQITHNTYLLKDNLAYMPSTYFIKQLKDILLKRDYLDILYKTVCENKNYTLLKYILQNKLIDKRVLQHHNKYNTKLFKVITRNKYLWPLTLFSDFNIEPHSHYHTDIAIMVSGMGNVTLLAKYIYTLKKWAVRECMYQAVLNNHFIIIRYLLSLNYSPKFGIFKNIEGRTLVKSFDKVADEIYIDNLLTLSIRKGQYFIATELIKEGSINLTDINNKAIKLSAQFIETDNDIFELLMASPRVRATFSEWMKPVISTIYYLYTNYAKLSSNIEKNLILKNRLYSLIKILPQQKKLPPLKEKCGICLEKKDPDCIYDLICPGCKHRFHFLCITGWFIKNDLNHFGGQCPLCRANIDTLKSPIGLRELQMDSKDSDPHLEDC